MDPQQPKENVKKKLLHKTSSQSIIITGLKTASVQVMSQYSVQTHSQFTFQELQLIQ